MRPPLLLFTGLLLAAAPPIAADGSFGSPNPATRQCVELGGIARLADEGFWGGPQVGLCRLYDDGIVDEWTLYRAVHGSGSLAVDAFLSGQWTPLEGPIETWADQACDQAGGQVVKYAEHLRPGSDVDLCEFDDGSSIETWTVFSGPDYYPELARLLELANPADAAFWHCPWPRTCMAPCLEDAPAEVICRTVDGKIETTSFACCCCGAGTNWYAPLATRPSLRSVDSR